MTFALHRYALTASALALALQGCATGDEGEPASLNIRPAPTATSQLSARDALYASATSAINRSDYGYALDLLQAARDRGGEDARILNAFAVVYDKLGRFDLSQRYYAAARALDPSSRIVAQNLAYSQVLQGRSAPIELAAASETAAAPRPAVAAAAPPSPSPAATVVAPVAMASLAALPQLPRTELRNATLGGPVRPTPALNAPTAEAAPATEHPLALATPPAPAPSALARAATPWDAPAILRPASAPASRTAIAPHGAASAPVAVHVATRTSDPPQPVERPRPAAVAVKPAVAKVQTRQPATVAPVRTAATTASAHRSPQRLAANTPSPRAAAQRTASLVRPASAARPAPAPRAATVARAEPSPRGWTLAAAHEQMTRMLSRGLRFLEDLERCRNGCPKVTVPLNAKPTLRVTDKAPGGPPYLS